MNLLDQAPLLARRFRLFFIIGYLCGARVLLLAGDTPPAAAVDMAGLTVHPAPLDMAPPVYPPDLRKHDVEGSATIEFIIDVNGRVVSARVVTATETEFGTAALAAARRWRFRPGQINGRPVYTRIQQQLEFKLQDEARKEIRIEVFNASAGGTLPPELAWDKPPMIPHDLEQVVYPFDLLQRGIKGRAVVNFVIGFDGRAQQITVHDATLPEFGEAAVAALDTMIFSPAQNKGKPALALVQAIIQFEPDGNGDVYIGEVAKKILAELKKPKSSAILSLQELGYAPKRVTTISPQYPPNMRREGKSGQALIEYFIDRNGDVQLPRIVTASDPAFGAAAAQAISNWAFEPPKKNGKRVIVRVQMPIEFTRPAVDPKKPAR